MDWLIILIVSVTTAAALAVVFKIQRDRLRHRFRLEIVNEGNVQSRYQLRAEGSGALRFRFTLDGDELPQEEAWSPEDLGPAGTGPSDQASDLTAARPEGPRQKAGAAGWGLQQAAGLTAVLADILMALGSLLPHSVGGPLLRRASQLQMGRIRMAQARRVSGQVAGLGSSARRASAGTRPGAPGQKVTAAKAGQAASGQPYVETPSVRPGQTLAIDLVVRAAAAVRSQAYNFRVLSRSMELENAALVVEEGQVRIGGGFWSRRYLPYLAILATGVVVLLFALWVFGTSAPF